MKMVILKSNITHYQLEVEALLCVVIQLYVYLYLIKNTPGVKKGGQELNRPC